MDRPIQSEAAKIIQRNDKIERSDQFGSKIQIEV
jgi:hypothetical protein